MPSNTIIQHLKTLHGRMKRHAVPNVVTLVKANLEKRLVLLEPVGLVAPPTDVRQLVTALRDILTALVALHKLKLMHRDLRWDNVLKYQQDRDAWFLIDFDEGTSAPSTQGGPHLDPTSHAPEIASSHSVKVDILGRRLSFANNDCASSSPSARYNSGAVSAEKSSEKADCGSASQGDTGATGDHLQFNDSHSHGKSTTRKIRELGVMADIRNGNLGEDSTCTIRSEAASASSVGRRQRARSIAGGECQYDAKQDPTLWAV